MTFEHAHDTFLQFHIANRTGERRGRLERGHNHAEELFTRNVWYPEHGNLDNLHPEYEVLDWRGRSYYADFLFNSGYVKLLIEIKGFNTYVREMDRHKYCNELYRETFLHAMGLQLISFAYDDVEQRPEICITLLRMVLSRYQPSQIPTTRANYAEKEIIRLTVQLARAIRPKDVEIHFSVDPKTAVVMLHKLSQKGWLLPVRSGKGIRVLRYELARGVLDYMD